MFKELKQLFGTTYQIKIKNFKAVHVNLQLELFFFLFNIYIKHVFFIITMSWLIIKRMKISLINRLSSIYLY